MPDNNELHEYIKKNEEYHEVEREERAEMKEMIRDLHKAWFGNKDTGEEGMVKQWGVFKDFLAFWRVFGIGLGFAAALGAGIAGVLYIFHLFKTHA